MHRYIFFKKKIVRIVRNHKSDGRLHKRMDPLIFPTQKQKKTKKRKKEYYGKMMAKQSQIRFLQRGTGKKG